MRTGLPGSVRCLYLLEVQGPPAPNNRKSVHVHRVPVNTRVCKTDRAKLDCFQTYFSAIHSPICLQELF